jgi:hypothetical protein
MVSRVVAAPVVTAIADKRGIAATLAICAVFVFAGYCSLGLASGLTPGFIDAVLVAMALGLMPPLADALRSLDIRRVEDTGLGRIAYGPIRVWTSIGVFGHDAFVGFGPAQNMSRFYRLDTQPDLFGGVLLVKGWGAHRHTRAHDGRAIRQRSPCRRRLATAGLAQEATRIGRARLTQNRLAIGW